MPRQSRASSPARREADPDPRDRCRKRLPHERQDRGRRTRPPRSRFEYEPFTDRTIRTPAEFLAELDRVRADGFARDSAEHETFINCVAAPIRDGAGTVVAAASISVPTLSLPAHEVLALLPQLMAATGGASADPGWAERPTADREDRP